MTIYETAICLDELVQSPTKNISNYLLDIETLLEFEKRQGNNAVILILISLKPYAIGIYKVSQQDSSEILISK